MRFPFVQLRGKASFGHSPIKDLPNTFYVLCPVVGLSVFILISFSPLPNSWIRQVL